MPNNDPDAPKFTAADDKRLCRWLGIEAECTSHGGVGWFPEPHEWTFLTLLTHPTPNTEAMVRDALLAKGYGMDVGYDPDEDSSCQLYVDPTDGACQNVASVTGPADGVIALAANALMEAE